MRARTLMILIPASLLTCLLAGTFIYYLPPVHERLSWRLANLRAEVHYALNPPEKEIFLPREQQDQVATIVQATLQALTPALASAPPPSLIVQPAGGDPIAGKPTASAPTASAPTASAPTASAPTASAPTAQPVSPSPTPLPSFSPTPLPAEVELTGFVHEYQKFNNCGPANLSMALSYWGWQGDQFVTRAYLRPSYASDDKNVNPFEMVDFVLTQTDLKALWRVGGDLALLKRLVAAGFPVIIEKGLQLPKEYWLGHFEIVSGYAEARNQFYVYDSYIGPEHAFPISYTEVETNWRHFNNVYVVIYPPERQPELLAILGPQADARVNFQSTAAKALAEAGSLSGRDLFFAWFNQGMSLVGLEDYAGAAQAFDYAYAHIYPEIPEADRPWRLLWYQWGPYPAYYYTGRYQDLINLAQTTLAHVDKPVLDETYYWRGRAREALGELEGAIADYRRAAALNPRATPALAELQRLGIAFP
jgi:tetratricopeptide (TPR) repeat protein